MRVLLLCLLSACGPTTESPPTDPKQPPAQQQAAPKADLPEARYLGAAELEGRDPLVVRQIREREAWHRRALEGADVMGGPLAPGEADGELGNLYQAYGFAEAALASYARARALAPEEARWAYYQGRVFFSRDRLEESLESLEDARRLGGDEPGTLVRLGEVLRDLNRPEEARERLEEAVQRGSSAAVARFYLGELAASAERLEEAVEHFRAVLELQPEALSVHYPLALAYRDLGREQDARQHLELRGEGEPTLDDPLTQKLWGLADGQRLFQKQGQEAFAADEPEKGLEALRRAVAADPLFSLPRYNLGTALASLGRLEDAEAAFRGALALASDDVRLNEELGHVLRQLRRSGDAVEPYRVAARAHPEDPARSLRLALALEESGQLEAGLESYRRTLALDERSTAAYLGEASALLRLKRDGEARRRLEAGLEVLQRSGELSNALARVLATSADDSVRDAARALELAEALFQARQDPEHAETLAMALAESGRYAEAAQLQGELVRGARAAGREDLVPRYQRWLEAYENGRPCRAPWRG